MRRIVMNPKASLHDAMKCSFIANAKKIVQNTGAFVVNVSAATVHRAGIRHTWAREKRETDLIYIII